MGKISMVLNIQKAQQTRGGGKAEGRRLGSVNTLAPSVYPAKNSAHRLNFNCCKQDTHRCFLRRADDADSELLYQWLRDEKFALANSLPEGVSCEPAEENACQ